MKLAKISIELLLLLRVSSFEDFKKEYAENRSLGCLTSQKLELLVKKLLQRASCVDFDRKFIYKLVLKFPVCHKASKLVDAT
jgi:hypothetical protein